MIIEKSLDTVQNVNKENAPQVQTKEQEGISLASVKPTSERLERITQNRKIFVMRYESVKSAGLLRSE